jgi:hypothetical protein
VFDAGDDDGNITEVALWNVALTEAQVQSLYGNGGSTAKKADTIPTGVRAYYDGSSLDNAAVIADDKATLVTAEATIDNGITDLDAGNADSAHDLSGFIVQSGSSLVGKTLDTFRVNLCKKSTGTHPAVYLVMDLCSHTGGSPSGGTYIHYQIYCWVCTSRFFAQVHSKSI